MALNGEVVFQRIFDLGGTLDLKKVRAILSEMAEAGAVQPKRAAPEYVSFAAPIPLNLASLNLDIQSDLGAVSISARLYEVGALAIMIRMPVRAEKMSDLSRYAAWQPVLKGQTIRRAQLFNLIAEAIRPRLKTTYDEVFEVPVEAESYTAFCLTEVPGGAEYILKEDREQVAALLTGEPYPEKLSQMEVDDTLKNWSSYYRDDIVVADWDAALLVEPSGKYEDLLYIFEVANLQLLALRKYDLYLDQTLERGYEEYERLSKRAPLFAGSAREMLRDLSEVRMDLAKVTDEVANTAKFFGDWYIARIYIGLAGKLHVRDYQKVVEEKLATLNDLYQSVRGEIDKRQNIILEVAIVVLIIFEVAMAFWRH